MASYVPLTSVIPQLLDDNANLLSGGKFKFYEAGTTTPTTVYSDASGTALGTEVTLDSDGQPQTAGGAKTLIWLDTGQNYKIEAVDSAGVTVWGPFDDIPPFLSVTTEVIATGTTQPRTLADWTAEIVGQRLTSYTELKALSLSQAASVKRAYTLGRASVADGGEGLFVWLSGDQSSNVAADPQQGIWVAPTGDPTGATGAWKREHVYGVLNLRHFGATGIEGDDATAAIDAVFAYCEAFPHVHAASINGERGIWTMYNGWTIYAPRGAYDYSGTGHDIADQKVWKIQGDGPSTSIIRILSDVHLLREVDGANNNVSGYVEFNSIKIQGGRGAYFSSKTDASNVQHGKRIYNCVFAGYTSAAFGSLNSADARWHIQQSVFEGGNAGTPVGLVLPDEVAECDISGNSFTGNKYQIIVRPESTRYAIGPNNFFFNSAVGNREADIWIIPAGINDFDNAGGFRITGNRFSNENALNDKVILIADRDGTTFDHVFTHATTKSDGWAGQITISDCPISRAGTTSAMANPGAVYSYAYKIGALTVKECQITSIPYVLEFDPVVTHADVDAGQNFLNRFYPQNAAEVANLEALVDFSNVRGSGLVVSDGVKRGYFSEIAGFASGITDFVSLHLNNQTDTLAKDSSVTLTSATDVEGGTFAATAVFGDDGVILLSTGVDKSSFIAGAPMWTEFDIKAAPSNSLTAVKLEFRFGTNVGSITVPVTPQWRRVQYPVCWADDYSASGTWEVRLRPAGFLAVGSEDSVMIGRKAMYHSSGPVDYEKVRIT